MESYVSLASVFLGPGFSVSDKARSGLLTSYQTRRKDGTDTEAARGRDCALVALGGCLIGDNGRKLADVVVHAREHSLDDI